MEWFAQKLDALAAAVIVAVMAISAAQAQAFIVQYTHRLGGQLDEARANLTSVETGLRYKLMSDTVRGEIETDARARADALQHAYNSIAHTNVLTRPVALIRHGDRTMITSTWRDFAPALPTTKEGLAYVVIGILVGFVIYEVIKLPLAVLLREPRRRKFRRRG